MMRTYLYIDPATSAYIVQIVAGVVISCGVVLGIFRTRISMAFKKRKIARLEKKITREAAQKQSDHTEKQKG